MAAEQLNPSDKIEVLSRVAELTGHSLPLAAGLEIAAKETANRKVRVALRRIADALNGGMPLDRAIQEAGPTLGPETATLIQAGTSSGRLTEVITALVGDVKARQYVRRQVRNVLVYPLILLSCSLAILLFTLLYVVPHFRNIFGDFGIVLPTITSWVLEASALAELVWKPFLAGFAIVVIGAIAFGGSEAMQTFIHRIPLLGPVLRWSSEMSGLKLLGLLTEVEVPLPQALRQVAGSAKAHGLRNRANAAAKSAEQGNPDWWMAYGGETDVANLAALASVGAGKGNLSAACFAAAEILEGRIRALLHQVRLVVPATIFVFTVIVTGITIIAMFLPMIKLLNELGS